jgi:hypothetical protein
MSATPSLQTKDATLKLTDKKKKTLKRKSNNVESLKVKSSDKSVKKSLSKKNVDVEQVVAVSPVLEDELLKSKKVKKINNAPTLSDQCGLNFSLAKVKNIISNNSINREIVDVINDMNTHRVRNLDSFTFSLDSLPENTRQYLQRTYDEYVHNEKLEFSKNVISSWDKTKRKEYFKNRKLASQVHDEQQKKSNLFNFQEFDSVSFNESLDKNFYDGCVLVNTNELKNEELYNFYNDLINKNKIRFNSESKLYITAFVEHLVKQLVENGTRNCVLKNKKIIQLEHALDMSSDNFPLLSVVSELHSYKLAMRFLQNKNDDVVDESVEGGLRKRTWNDVLNEMQETLQLSNKQHFKYYVSELCRSVRTELSRTDSSVSSSDESVFNQTSVSKVFKLFCSNLIIEFLDLLGKMLKVEVLTRNIKTVNYTTITTVINLLHIMNNLSSELPRTVKFIQERYVMYKSFLDNRRLTKQQNKL